MATVHVCDRCRSIGVSVRAVLDVELCDACVADMREFIATPVDVCSTSFAMRIAISRGSVSVDDLSALTGEPKRKVYYRLRNLLKKGLLRALGGGVFAPVRTQEAAE